MTFIPTPLSEAQTAYANECLCCMTFEDGVLSVDYDGFSTDAIPTGVTAVGATGNNGVFDTVYGDAEPSDYPYGTSEHPIKQTCDGRIFADPSGGFAGTWSESGSFSGFNTEVDKELCIPIQCKKVCDTSEPLKLVYMGCIEIAGTWTKNKLSTALSAEVKNHISILNPDGSINCKTQGTECFEFTNQESSIEILRLANSYFLNGCVECSEDGLKIALNSIQSSPVGGTIFLNDAFYRINLSFMLLRECP